MGSWLDAAYEAEKREGSANRRLLVGIELAATSYSWHKQQAPGFASGHVIGAR